MRLINTKTYQLTEFDDHEVPWDEYAILSHTWGAEEVIFSDMEKFWETFDDEIQKKKGFAKIRYTCQQAVQDGYKWAWVDTCCIDKTSNSELQEAIRSMFRWYEKAGVCYAYLADVHQDDDRRNVIKAFRRSRWFTRGWTLQELIAPTIVRFYTSNWACIVTRKDGSQIATQNPGAHTSSLMGHHKSSSGSLTIAAHDDDEAFTSLISEITRIPSTAFGAGEALDQFSVAQRMSWASSRTCRKVEDMAHCLFGLFGIFTSMMYGDGEKAFCRLQEQIVDSIDDDSLYAWTIPEEDNKNWTSGSILAPSPRCFRDSADVIATEQDSYHISEMTKQGLRMPLRKFWSLNNGPAITDSSADCIVIPLNCRSLSQPALSLCLVLAPDENITMSNAKKHWYRRLVTSTHVFSTESPEPAESVEERPSYIFIRQSSDFGRTKTADPASKPPNRSVHVPDTSLVHLRHRAFPQDHITMKYALQDDFDTFRKEFSTFETDQYRILLDSSNTTAQPIGEPMPFLQSWPRPSPGRYALLPWSSSGLYMLDGRGRGILSNVDEVVALTVMQRCGGSAARPWYSPAFHLLVWFSEEMIGLAVRSSSMPPIYTDGEDALASLMALGFSKFSIGREGESAISSPISFQGRKWAFRVKQTPAKDQMVQNRNNLSRHEDFTLEMFYKEETGRSLSC